MCVHESWDALERPASAHTCTSSYAVMKRREGWESEVALWSQTLNFGLQLETLTPFAAVRADVKRPHCSSNLDSRSGPRIRQQEPIGGGLPRNKGRFPKYMSGERMYLATTVGLQGHSACTSWRRQVSGRTSQE